ncbi:unnamed protein product [Pleuronectes platessa]|uniref:Uncharacterized protein n=1 Tax=Pleuronectes platessa TaxID=8262 RepID=A0A9N7YSW9_PLEPL|nr:unnamed protein product [Pleuronectes platessa]
MEQTFDLPRVFSCWSSTSTKVRLLKDRQVAASGLQQAALDADSHRPALTRLDEPTQDSKLHHWTRVEHLYVYRVSLGDDKPEHTAFPGASSH